MGTKKIQPTNLNAHTYVKMSKRTEMLLHKTFS